MLGYLCAREWDRVARKVERKTLGVDHDLHDIGIYDVLGREITTLLNEPIKPGTYEIEWNASDYPTGVYYYKLVADNYTETKKMVLIK